MHRPQVNQIRSTARRQRPAWFLAPAVVAVMGVAAFGVASVAASQQDDQQGGATTRQADDPSREQGDQRENRRGDRDGRDSPGRGGFGRPWSEPTPEEWEQALTFLREHSPRRLALFESALEEWRRQQDPNAQQPEPRNIRGFRALIYERVRLLRRMEEHDPGLYGIALEQFRLEDQIIGHLYDARKAKEADQEAEHDQAMQRAREAVELYAQGMLEEREQRIARMRDELSREEQRLEHDRSNFDELVKRMQERFERSLPGRRERERREEEQRQGQQGDDQQGAQRREGGGG